MDDEWVYTDSGRQQFNATLLHEYGYVIYPNNTISNASSCFLAFGSYVPTIISNGSVYNSSSCETPVRPIRTRGIIGLVVAAIFAVLLVLACVSLRKQGKSFLPLEKRFRLVGRRWPWYWVIITCAFGVISGITAVDIDRVWVPGTSAIFHFFFYLCTLPTTLAAIWEMTRNWASFHERKGVDEDYFRHKQDDRRAKIEFYMPLVFYLFTFLVFFLSVLRVWTPIAKSNAHVITDDRFRAASIFAVMAWMTIVASCFVSRYYYRPIHIPAKIWVSIVIILVRLVFNIGSSFEFSFSQLHYQANPAYIYCLGFLPDILVVVTMIYSGIREPNEDRVILRLRNIRNQRLDGEMSAIKPTVRRKSATPSRTTRNSKSHNYWAGTDDDLAMKV